MFNEGRRARHVLSLSELSATDIARMVERGVELGRMVQHPKTLAGKVVGILFTKTSTRTRTAFSVGSLRLGASILTYGPQDLQTNTGETLADTGRVLSGYLDAVVIRTNESLDDMRMFAADGRMAVVNAMSSNEHPTQAIADLCTMLEAFGRVEGLRVVYLGEGNNSAAALALGLARIPRTHLTLLTPEGYGLPAESLELARRLADSTSTIEERHSTRDLPTNVDVVYTTRWQTMGVPKADANWKTRFREFSVSAELLERMAGPRTIFMHDLPAVRGDDVHDEVLDGPRSWAFRQAEHKMFAAMAVLEWCLGVS
jgi:ornithine carbamoyltransferase